MLLYHQLFRDIWLSFRPSITAQLLRPRLLCRSCHSSCPSRSSFEKTSDFDFHGYDPSLKLVASLNNLKNGRGEERDSDSPFLLPDMDRDKYASLFDEQLRLEETTFTSVLNVARRGKAKPMEALIDEWEWERHIELNLYKAVKYADLHESTAPLKDSMLRECSQQLLKLTHVILCKGQSAVPVNQLERILGRILLRLNKPDFYKELHISESDSRQALERLFDMYIEYFMDANLAQKYTLREWWNKCVTRSDLSTLTDDAYPFEQFEFSTLRELQTLLLSVLIESCHFKLPQRNNKSTGKQSSQNGKRKKAKGWPSAFSLRDLAISEQSPHVDVGETTFLCKMLCVHPQLIHHYYAIHGFEHLLFPSEELPFKLPPRPWLDRGACGPFYTFSQKFVRKLEAFPHMRINYAMMTKRIKHKAQARPVFDALNVLGATPWIINKEMLGHVRRALKMSYLTQNAEFLKPLSIPRHPSTFNVPFSPEKAWQMGVFNEHDLEGIIVNAQLDDEQNRREVLNLLRATRFWTQGKSMQKSRKNKSEQNATAPMIALTEDQEREIAKRYFRKVNSMYREKCEQHSLHCWLIYRIVLAHHYANSVLYFPHNIDFRGRAYPISPQINHMGDDLNRGLLKFAKGKPLGRRGLEWLKLHCINITGRKKRSSLRERLEFAEQNVPLMTAVADDPFNPANVEWWHESDEPWQTLAACIELRDALRTSRPEEFVSHLPIHQDGSCNGLQHYAAMGRDLEGAKEVNLLPEDVPQDLYSSVAERVEEMRIKHEKDANHKRHKVACELREKMPEKLERKIIKQTIMTTVYGVTKYGARAQIARQLYAIGLDREKSRRDFAPYLAENAFEGLSEAFTQSMALMKWFKRCARQALKLKQKMEWITPLGLPVLQPYVTVEVDKYGELIFLPVRHKQINAFPPNFVHSLDATHMMLTALHCHSRGITYASVHDCFWTHACDVDEMNKICRDQFIALHEQPITKQLSEFLHTTFLEEELVQEMAKSKTGKKVLDEVTTGLKLDVSQGSLDINKVRDSLYFFS